MQFKTLASHDSLSMLVSGGTSGAVPSGDHGGPSPDPTGANGVVTFTEIHASQLTNGASKTIRKGSSLTVATVLSDRATAAPITHRTVTLFQRHTKTGAWSKVTTKKTSSIGQGESAGHADEVHAVPAALRR